MLVRLAYVTSLIWTLASHAEGKALQVASWCKAGGTGLLVALGVLGGHIVSGARMIGLIVALGCLITSPGESRERTGLLVSLRCHKAVVMVVTGLTG